MCAWQQQDAARRQLCISVNLSSRQFLQADIGEQIRSILKDTRLDPQCLKIEITESHIMQHTEMTSRTLSGLREPGVELSIDDFGTGYSSLSYLHRLR